MRFYTCLLNMQTTNIKANNSAFRWQLPADPVKTVLSKAERPELLGMAIPAHWEEFHCMDDTQLCLTLHVKSLPCRNTRRILAEGDLWIISSSIKGKMEIILLGETMLVQLICHAAFAAEYHSFAANPCALGLQAPEMHKPHLNFTFVHHLPSQDFSPFLDSCIPLWFQQEERTKTTLPHHKRTPCILQQKEGPRCLTSSSSLLSFQFEQEENNNFSFCNSVHTSQKHSSSILTTEPPAFQVQTCVSKAWTETGLKWDCNIHFYLWLLALKHRSIEMSQSHFENSF